MIERLQQQLLALQKPPGIIGRPGMLPLGIPAIDTALGGGFLCGALHEITASGEAHLPAATGFALGVAKHSGPSPHLFWITEDMTIAENGALHGVGFDGFGLASERLVTISVAHRRDLLWAMEEVLRCRAVNSVIGEVRVSKINEIAVRRLSLAAAENGALALLLRTVPANDASIAATRWIISAAPSSIAHGPGAPRFVVQLVRNRRGPTGSWILEWSENNEQFSLATDAQPVAAATLDRSHRKIA